MLGIDGVSALETDYVGETKKRFVAKAIPGIGWRIWNRKQAKWWGNPFSHHPEELLLELNGARRPDKIVELTKMK